MNCQELNPVLFMLLMLPGTILLFPAVASFQANGLESPPNSADLRIQQQFIKREPMQCLSRTASPAALSAEFVNPNYPNYMQAFVQVSFDVTVRLIATDFNYTQINASIAFDPGIPGDPAIELVSPFLSPGNIATKRVGDLAAGENTTVTWEAIPVRYDAAATIRLVRFNATGLLNGQYPQTIFESDLIETHLAIMTVEGPFPVEDHDDVDYELKYKKSKTLMLNITSGINGTHNLTGVQVTVTTDDRLEANYSSAELNSLAPGEFYLYNFTVKSVSKDAAKSAMTIEVASNVTPSYTLELNISVLEAPEDEWFGYSPVGSLFILVSALTFVIIYRKGRNPRRLE